jgi:hypothetical protein
MCDCVCSPELVLAFIYYVLIIGSVLLPLLTLLAPDKYLYEKA